MKTKIPKSVRDSIEEINEMLPKIHEADEFPCSYFGGTWPIYTGMTKPIEIKNQFVYIRANSAHGNIGPERFNCNDEYQVDSLKFHLKHIKQSYKKVLK